MDAEARAATAAGWHDWLSAQMTKAGMRQVDLVRASHGRLLPAAVSKWMRGEFTASPENAITVARILGVSPIDALAAAGHHELANAVEAHLPVAEGAAPDPTVAMIESEPHLTARERQYLVTAYRGDLEQARQRAAQTAELLVKARTAK